MKTSPRIGVISIFSFLMVLFVNNPMISFAQVKYRSNDLTISIKGTSSLHDWEITSDKGRVDAVFVMGTNLKMTGLSGLHFTVKSESLKSGNNMMDGKTYKALKTNAFDSISFNLKSATIVQQDAGSYQLKCLGNLTIAGVTRETELLAACKLNGDKTFTCSGAKKLKMTDFNVKPPVALMGTIKTGDEISVGYNLKIVK